jgi:hypothetical protein
MAVSVTVLIIYFHVFVVWFFRSVLGSLLQLWLVCR